MISYSTHGKKITFNKNFNEPSEPYYKIISQMIFLELGRKFYLNQTFVLMPNIKMLTINSIIAQKLRLTKNIVFLKCCCVISGFFPKNIIYIDLFIESNGNYETPIKVEINKNMKYIFMKRSHHPIKMPKNVSHCAGTKTFSNLINKNMLHLCVNTNQNIKLPKKLMSLVLKFDLQSSIILTPYIRRLVIGLQFKKHIVFEYPIETLRIYNCITDKQIMDNMPNDKGARYISLMVNNVCSIRNMPNDVGNFCLGKDVITHKGVLMNVVEYGTCNKPSSTLKQVHHVDRIYAQLVQSF